MKVKETKTKQGKILFENESFKIRETSKEEREEMKKDKQDDNIEVEYKDLKLNLCGFEKIVDKKTKKLIFGFKIKGEDRNVLLHIPSDLSLENRAKVDMFIQDLSALANTMGYNITDTDDIVKNLYNEKHIFDKIDKDKKK